MARWKALPDGLDPAVVQLVVRLRQLKDAKGLSLDRLAAQSGYSASSWERYLGGRLLPPQEAVEALARIAGADAVRLRVLHEAAKETWRQPDPHGLTPAPAADDQAGRTPATDGAGDDATDGAGEDAGNGAGDGAPSPEAAPAVTAPRRRSAWRSMLSVAVVSALIGAGLAVLAARTWPAALVGDAAHPTPTLTPSHRYSCHMTRVDGLWYAGNSRTTSDEVMVGSAGPEVAEVQCLLQRAGVSPGGVDGSFGPMTEKAVIEEQLRQHLSVDGQVGPQTWGVLRR